MNLLVLMSAAVLALQPSPCPASADPLVGKRLAVIGDSYVKNHTRPVSETWHARLAAKHGMSYANYGVNGGRLVLPDPTGKPVSERYAEMDDALDYVFVIAGHNDAEDLSNPGAEKLAVAFRTGLADFADRLKARYPSATLVFVSPWRITERKGFEKVRAISRELLAAKGIPYFDTAAETDIEPAGDATRWERYQCRGDVAHLSYEGHTLMLERFEAWFAKILGHKRNAAVDVCAAIEAAWAKDGTKREQIEWVRVWREHADAVQTSKLPKVLVIGDSIVGNYFPTVSAELDGIAICTRLNGSRVVGDPVLLKEFQIVNDVEYDVIHLNNGLHGYDTTEADYGRRLGEYVDYIRACQPQARVVWGSSTQMMPTFGEYEKRRDRLVERNRLADEVMRSRGISTTDLYAITLGKPDLYATDGIHYNAKGARELGLAVAASIKKALGR